jgi:3-hydroxyacyl-[acyl-carrier-protein] dehydratase
MTPSCDKAFARSIRQFNQSSHLYNNEWQFNWIFGLDDPAFAGHFPGCAVLPGVFLMEMAQHAAQFALERCGYHAPRLERITRFRFISPILPGASCTLTLRWPEQELAAQGPVGVNAIFNSGKQMVARGTLEIKRGNYGLT